MKQLYTFLLCFATINIFAQAPNFTVTDTHGNEHNLYEDYLDQGKTVVLDFFFVGCAACEFITDPFLIDAYNEWGAGQGDVEFISITSRAGDTDPRVIAYEAANNVIWPGVSSDGGALDAIDYYLGPPWNLNAFPTLVVVGPDRSIQFDPWSNTSGEQTITTLNAWIANTGAIGLSSIDDLSSVEAFNVFPNPTMNNATINIELNKSAEVKIELYSALGQRLTTLFNDQLNGGEQRIELPQEALVQGLNWIGVSVNGETQMTQIQKI